MAHQDRNFDDPGSRRERGGRMERGMPQDRYATGGERRYAPNWDESSPQDSGFRGDRSYQAGGYAEEFGYRRPGPHHSERRQGERGGDFGMRDEDLDDDRRWAGARDYGSQNYARGSFGEHFDRESRDEPIERDEWRWRDQRERQQSRAPRAGSAGSEPMRWDDDRYDTGSYFGTGTYGGAYGSQPGSRVSGAGAYGGGGYFSGSQVRWDERDRDWLSQNRGTSGDFSNFGRSEFGAQSGYGREYGQSRDHERHQGYGRTGALQTHRGKGPKGYQRSDERLKEIICERLMEDPRVDAAEVSVEVANKVVTLSGTVDQRRTKYEIEDIVERCGGVAEIDNRLKVRRSQP